MQGARGEQVTRAHMVGKAGELAVAVQLLLRGLNSALPLVDTGYDLLTENGCRVQVKSGHVRTSPSVLKLHGRPIYSLHLPKYRSMATSKTDVKTTERRKLAEMCDVVVFWGIEENRFWIIPAALADQRQCVIFGPSNERSFDKDLPDMQEMVELGFSQAEIGEYYGIGQASVARRLQRAGTEKHGRSSARDIRACENRWELITDFTPATAQAQYDNNFADPLEASAAAGE